jgi:hypothetical protein
MKRGWGHSRKLGGKEAGSVRSGRRRAERAENADGSGARSRKDKIGRLSGVNYD